MRRIISIIATLLVCGMLHAQSLVAEIGWYDVNSIYYHGVLTVYNNNSGNMYVKYYNPYCGWVLVHQTATLTNTYDVYGNCTSYVNCSYPTSSPNIPYSADNFIFYPDGSVYTQDYQGAWSTAVEYRVVPQYEWYDLYSEFGIQ